MSSPQSALNVVTSKRFAFWKLYKGTIKVSQCGEEENPTKDAAEAARLFAEELELRAGMPGNYYVNTYRNNNGDKGGFRYDFTIDANQPRLNNFTSAAPMSDEALRAQIRREMNIDDALKRIEEKMDSILLFIAAKESEETDDDKPALDFVKNLAKQALTQGKNGAAAAGAGFASLLK